MPVVGCRVDEQLLWRKAETKGTHPMQTGPDGELVDFMLLARSKWNIKMLLFRGRSDGGRVLESLLDQVQHRGGRSNCYLLCFIASLNYLVSFNDYFMFY